MIDKILVPLDGSRLADLILVHVRRLLFRTDAQVSLLRVVPEDQIQEIHPPGRQPLGLARKHVEKLAHDLAEQGTRATTHVHVGDAATKILEVAELEKPSLIAMSTHGRSGVPRMVRGSIAEKVLRGSEWPILLVTSLAHEAQPTFKLQRILVPLDASDRASEIVPLAADLARLHGTELILVHVRSDASSPPTSAFDALQGVKDVKARMVVKAGNAAQGILEAAQEEDADLICMTTHGRSGLSRLLYGSVAEEVLRRSPCPVLVRRTVASVPSKVGANA